MKIRVHELFIKWIISHERRGFNFSCQLMPSLVSFLDPLLPIPNILDYFTASPNYHIILFVNI